MKNYYAVIMAGGGGTRLWPVSRNATPKQTLALLSERSLFQIAVERIMPLIPAENIFVVTIAEQARMLQQLVQKIPDQNYILEPAPRGTAAVVGLAAEVLHKHDPEAVMAVLTADHFIQEEEIFLDILLQGYLAAQHGYLVTLGIKPTYPAPGYGYIERGQEISSVSEQIYEVKAFKEKPTREIACAYMEAGNYYWNSGMFVWRADQILKELNLHMPELSSGLDRIRASLGGAQAQEIIHQVWDNLESVTIDYGIMEKAENVVVIPAASIGWCDIGGWDRFWDVAEADERGNIIIAPNAILLESSGSLIYQKDMSRNEPRLIAAIGMEDIVIVDTDEILMICPRNRADDVKQFIKILKKTNNEKYL